MRSIPPLKIQDNRLFRAIAAAKQPPNGAEMNALAPVAKIAYAAYAQAAPAVDTLDEVILTAAQRTAMLHAYNVETAPFSAARVKLLGRARTAVCPYCAIGESTSLDHYLPKDDYPIFAVYSRNLVPSCPNCNTRKRKLVVDEAESVRAFFHPYYDPVPTQRFIRLTATLHPRVLSLSFTLVRPAGVAIEEFKQIRSHFGKLKLAQRYRLRSLSDIGDRLDTFRRWHAQGGAAKVSAELAKEAGDYTGTLGSSSWKVLLYETLSCDAAFCDQGYEVVARQP